MAPVKLTVDERVIVLHQVAHSITIPLEEPTKTYVFTPDDPQKAIEAINKQIP